MITWITWKLYLLKKTTKLVVSVLLKVSRNHCVQASWRWQITSWIWGNKKTGILNSMFNLPAVCWCACESLLSFPRHLLMHLHFLTMDYINDFGCDLNRLRYRWLWFEWWFVTGKGSIEPQRCIDFFTKWIFVELQNHLLTFLGRQIQDNTAFQLC